MLMRKPTLFTSAGWSPASQAVHSHAALLYPITMTPSTIASWKWPAAIQHRIVGSAWHSNDDKKKSAPAENSFSRELNFHPLSSATLGASNIFIPVARGEKIIQHKKKIAAAAVASQPAKQCTPTRTITILRQNKRIIQPRWAQRFNVGYAFTLCAVPSQTLFSSRICLLSHPHSTQNAHVSAEQKEKHQTQQTAHTLISKRSICLALCSLLFRTAMSCQWQSNHFNSNI